jgi:general secretion pathway protein D
MGSIMCRRYVRALCVAFSVMALSSCEEQTSNSAGMFGQDGPIRSGHASRGQTGHAVVTGTRLGTVQRGTDTFIDGEVTGNLDAGRAIVVPSGGEKVQLSLVNATIEAAAKAVLSDTLKMNYVVGQGVQGSVTIQTTGPIPKDSLFELFEASLSANGAQLRKEGNVIHIVAGTTGNTMFKVVGTGGATSSSIMVAPLKYISATEMTKLLEPLTSQGLKVVAEQKRNMLLLSGSSEILSSALDALNLFDVDVLKGKSVALVQLRSADPGAIVAQLKKIFEAEEGGMLDGVIEFIPNPQLGSILIVTSRASYLDKAQKWIRELDQTATGSSVYMATYELQNRSASEVAPLLNDLLSGAASKSPTAALESESGDTPIEGDTRAALSDSTARVTADDSRNALIVRASREDQDQIQGLLQTLDSESRQVLLEATIAEVTLNDEVNVGTRWFFESGKWDFGFTDLSSSKIAGSNPGFTAVFGAGGADVALSALAGVTNVKIISSPTLMVLDNKEGVLQIGDQVPIATQSSTSSDTTNAPVLTKVEYRDTGIILRVKPRIGAGGRVLLDISQEVSNVAENKTSGIDSPTIRQRKVQTSVALGDGQTLALGGLVQENNSFGRTEVPGLGRVPVLGNLFRNKNSKKGRTELLILIRPRVVQNDDEAAAATSYWRAKLSGANSMLQTGLGSVNHSVIDFSQ